MHIFSIEVCVLCHWCIVKHYFWCQKCTSLYLLLLLSPKHTIAFITGRYAYWNLFHIEQDKRKVVQVFRQTRPTPNVAHLTSLALCLVDLLNLWLETAVVLIQKSIMQLFDPKTSWKCPPSVPWSFGIVLAHHPIQFVNFNSLGPLKKILMKRTVTLLQLSYSEKIVIAYTCACSRLNQNPQNYVLYMN